MRYVMSFDSSDGHIVLQARAAGEDGTIGDVIIEIYPDTELQGKLTFQQLKALGEGEVEIEETEDEFLSAKKTEDQDEDSDEDDFTVEPVHLARSRTVP